MISIVITTYGHDTLRTRRCLDAILTWKQRDHELIVVVHDESLLLGVYLRSLRDCGDIDKLLFAEPGHGHVRGVNLGLAHAKGSLLFNINTDVLVGGNTIDRIIHMFTSNKRLGLVGWHYNWAPQHGGSFWNGDRLAHTVRVRENLGRRPGYVDAEHMQHLRNAHWASGRVVRALGDRRILCANTSFFAIRAELWHRIGGFDEARYPHIWADDFLCYAVLDQGMDIANLPADIRCSQQPGQFDSQSDLEWESKRPDPYKFVDRISIDPVTGEYGSWQEQFHALIRRRAELGARMTITGDPQLVPRSLRQYCATGRGARSDSDYLLAGGTVTRGCIDRIRPGGALLQFPAGGHKVLPVPVLRSCYRRSRAPLPSVARTSLNRCA